MQTVGFFKIDLIIYNKQVIGTWYTFDERKTDFSRGRREFVAVGCYISSTHQLFIGTFITFESN